MRSCSAIRCSCACKPPGGPRQFQQLYGFQFVEQPDFKRVFVLLGGGNRNRRTIYTDGRKHVGQIQGNDDNPLFYGHGVARWEGDTFVVDNRGFNEEFWFDNGGLPHTEQLQLTERFTRVDMGTMRYEVTIDDPGAYTRAVEEHLEPQVGAGRGTAVLPTARTTGHELPITAGRCNESPGDEDLVTTAALALAFA